MKAILEFKLPEESAEFEYAQKGGELAVFVSDFYNESIRRRLKYTELPEAQAALLEEIKQEFIGLFGEYL